MFLGITLLRLTPVSPWDPCECTAVDHAGYKKNTINCNFLPYKLNITGASGIIMTNEKKLSFFYTFC